MEKLIVERITENTAILEREDRSHVEVPLSDFTFKIKQGNVLSFDGKDYTLDLDEENKRRGRLFSLQEKLKNKNKK